jgi:hypothetical protein
MDDGVGEGRFILGTRDRRDPSPALTGTLSRRARGFGSFPLRGRGPV